MIEGGIGMEAILLVWGVRDEVLRRIPVEGYWLYGEYDFIARVEFSTGEEMEEFERRIRRIIRGGTFKLIPVELSAVKGEKGSAITYLESPKVLVP